MSSSHKYLRERQRCRTARQQNRQNTSEKDPQEGRRESKNGKLQIKGK